MLRPLLQKTGPRRVLATVSLAPVTSLLVAYALSAAIGMAGLSQSLPVGVHTYLPAVNLVDIRLLDLASLVFALPGLALVAATTGGSGSRKPSAQARAVLQVGGLLVLVQLILYAAQALLVAQLQGLPDTVPAAMLALALQAILTLTATLSARTMPVLIPVPAGVRAPAAELSALAAGSRPCWPLVHTISGFIVLDAPRRGPPSLQATPEARRG